MYKAQVVILAIGLAVSFNSCSDKYTLCESSLNVALKAGFYNKNNTAVTPNNWNLSAANTGTIFTNVTDKNNFSLTLNPTKDSVMYILKLSPTSVPDSIYLLYITIVQNVSEDCGNVNTHYITKLYNTTNTIDSISIIEPFVNTTSGENFKIYY